MVRFICLSLTGMVLCASPSLLRAQTPDDGTHFVVLIDDSFPMRGDAWKYPNVRAVLPPALYRTLLTSGGDTLPGFDANRDRISLVWFGIPTQAPGELRTCDSRLKRNSALPDDMFVDGGTVHADTEPDFARQLNSWLANGCRGWGNLSPIATAPALVLPFLRDRGPSDRRDARTILVVVTDDEFNTLTSSPSNELTIYRSQHGTQRTVEALALADSLAEYFRFNTLHRAQTNGVSLYVIDVVPLANPRAGMPLPVRIDLDRVAVSTDELALRSSTPGSDRIRLFASEQLAPRAIEVGFRGADGQPWLVGSHVMPTSTRIELATSCASNGACVIEATGYSIDLFRLAAPEYRLGAEDPEPGPATAILNSVFDYNTGGLYDRMTVSTGPIEVELFPVEPLRVSLAPFPSKVLDNETLASLFDDDTDDLTQAAAASRLSDNRTRSLILAFTGLLAATIGFLIWAARFHLTRPFSPVLEWRPGESVRIDFNRPGEDRKLAGVLAVSNQGKIPWFGRLSRRDIQPSESAKFELGKWAVGEQLDVDCDVSPIGFIGGASLAETKEDVGDHLDVAVTEVVTHGKVVPVFVAEEAFRDLRASGASEEKIKLPLRFEMRWPNGRRTCSVELPVRFQPEQARPPQVSFDRGTCGETIEFRRGEKALVGHFVLRSSATHLFAEPFISPEYSLRVVRRFEALGGEPFELRTPDSIVSVRPRGTVRVPVYANFNGTTIPNPEAASDDYFITLVGAHSGESTAGPYRVAITRDSRVSEITLTLDDHLEVYPSGAGWKKRNRDGSGVEAVEGGRLRLRPKTIIVDHESPMPRTLLTMEVGNSARSADGHVAVKFRLSGPTGQDDEVSKLYLRDGRGIDSLVRLFHQNTEDASGVVVPESPNTARRDVKVATERLARVDGAEAKGLECEVTLDVEVRTADGDVTKRELTIVMPFSLEELPGSDWLCIDFGTSAVAAARGTGELDEVYVIPLQDVSIGTRHGGKAVTFGEQDQFNSEAESRYLIPSWITVDPDFRTSTDETNSNIKWLPGSPHSGPASKVPGDPTFIGLPATTARLENHPGRIVYSVKSWLVQASGQIRLDTPVRYVDGGTELEPSHTLPMKPVLASSFSALAEAYLKEFRADRLVLCYPNVFTSHHIAQLREVAFAAFGSSFKLANPRRIELISESDAVAYYFCRRLMSEGAPVGTKRILVFDFGAGTLDLSVIRVTWERGHRQSLPTEWIVEGRIGVPVAGMHMDSILGRLVDRILKDGDVLKGDSRLVYEFPVVSSDPPPADASRAVEYRRQAMQLWKDIRAAKHRWNGTEPLRVLVGNPTSKFGVVRAATSVAELRDSWGDVEPDSGATALHVCDSGELTLCIPARIVREAMEEFVAFVTEDVVAEQLRQVGVEPVAIDYIVTSGRGALWPGLRDRVCEAFPPSTFRYELPDADMKTAVVKGAIGRQVLRGLDYSDPVLKVRLGVLINDGEDIVMEEEWSEPIDLRASRSFSIVQVNLSDTILDPAKDMRTLRRYFYINLFGQEFRPDQFRSRLIKLTRRSRGGRIEILVDNLKGDVEPLFADAVAGQVTTRPPWPVGHYLLRPEYP